MVLRVVALLCYIHVFHFATLPSTCGTGSVSQKLPFCDTTKPFTSRTEDLLSRLTLKEKLDIFTGASSQFTAYLPHLNIKGFEWDSTCIHGIAPYHLHPQPNVTIFPVTIGMAASWNRSLIASVSTATWREARGLTQLQYEESGGTKISTLSCDGGPLANNAHDPRWGRISETYGEDPYLISEIGVTAVKSLQNAQVHNGETFLATSQVTRHFLGWHGANDMHLPQMNVSQHDLEDTYLPPYREYQVNGQAEGLMCSFAAVNGIPSCASPLLKKYVRDTWKSNCFIQSDCCDAITNIWATHHYAKTLQGAVVDAIKAGTQLAYSSSGHLAHIRTAFSAALQDGNLTTQELDDNVKRLLLTRFKLGEFDPASPFMTTNYKPYLNSNEHRHLARQVQAEGIVLLENNGILPLTSNREGTKKIALIGPFGACTTCQLHSYNGNNDDIKTVLTALKNGPYWNSTTVSFEEGSQIDKPIQNGISAAVKLAQESDVVILAVGLGNPIEREGHDRSSLQFPQPQIELIQAVRKAKASNVIALIHSAGTVAFDRHWADAWVQVWYGGEEAGTGIMDVLFGAVNPSAKMPLTSYAADYLSKIGPTMDYNMQSGVGRTYRWLQTYKDPPQYYFGYGLSYSVWRYSNLIVDWDNKNRLLTLRVDVLNVGPHAGAEIVQVYVRAPEEHYPIPNLSLVGFEKVWLGASEMKPVSFTIQQQKLSVVDEQGIRRVNVGLYNVWAGGNQPLDPNARSNVLSSQFTLT